MTTEPQEFDYLFKLVIIGDSGVGKTNLLTKYANNSFQENSKTTIGVELSTKVVTIEGKTIQNQIWDTAGQERFRAITSAYYRNAVGVIIVFDLTKPKTFENLTIWLKEVHQYAEPETCIMVIGNKSDLGASEIKAETIDNFINQNRLTYL
jgi:small GTP-binding protein